MKKQKYLLFLMWLLLWCLSARGQPMTTGYIVTPLNFVSGQLYTNYYKVPIVVSCTVTNVEAAAAGTTRFDVWVFRQGAAADSNGQTNSCGGQVLGTSLATTNNCGVLWAEVPVAFVWTFTNQSAGAGNAAGPRGGQIFIPKQ